ncbi:UDP-N-acetylmuramate--L-alanine ligase, partial [Candidatus Aerophobetes bacterium]|nr:UDP-N-acetylmuramate--L-alanine ligase [Candidatus Aerophobetes bacterium]
MHIHFIGIGGIGMSGVARFLLKKGYHVSGSDKKETELTEKLREEGAKIYIGHKPHHVEGAKAVVFSSAIKSSNPEIKEAIRRGIYLIPRGRMVANITNDMENIVVAGTHGKTTTTAVIAEFLLKKRIDPTIFIGGILKKINSNTKLGKDKIALVESDESDASFLFHHPDIAVITNIEDDHLDFYTSERNLIGAFSKFCNNTKSHGKIIINLDHPSSVYVLKKISPSRKVITYGFSPQASIKARKVILGTLSSSFQLIMGK